MHPPDGVSCTESMNFLREARDAFSGVDPEERVRLAHLGAVLFMAGSLTAIPAGLLLEPPPKLHEHVISAIGFASGVVLWRLDWARVPSAWLHVFPILGSVIVLAGVTVFSVVFSFFLVLGGMFIAVSVRSPRIFSAYIAFFVFALFLPLTYADGDLSQQAVLILATLPVLLAVALVSRYMHEVVERQRDQYRQFAAEAIALGERIRGSAERAGAVSAAELEERLKDLRRASSKDRRDRSDQPASWPPASS